jgi:hypothetical protein
MAESQFRGPLVNMGGLEDQSAQPFDGPSLNYAWGGWMDFRFTPMKKDGTQPARVPSFFNPPTVICMDNVPSALSTTYLATAQVATASTAMTLNLGTGSTGSTYPSLASGMPLVPFGTSVATTVSVIDFGFTTGTTVANSTAVTVVDATLFGAGGWYAMGAAGASNVSFFFQVISIANATTINISPAAITGITNAPIGHANLYGASYVAYGTQFGPSTATPNSVNPYLGGGLGAFFDPRQTIARNLSVASNTTVGGTAAILITGYDVFGVPMTELITANGTTAYGHKAFKYILSAVPQQTQGANYTLGVGDSFGFAVRAEYPDPSQVSYNGTVGTILKNGFTSALTIANGPSNNTAGDVRGTFQISTSGPLATGLLAIVGTNGTSRLFMTFDLPLFRMLGASALSTTSATTVFGLTQA